MLSTTFHVISKCLLKPFFFIYACFKLIPVIGCLAKETSFTSIHGQMIMSAFTYCINKAMLYDYSINKDILSDIGDMVLLFYTNELYNFSRLSCS